MANPVKHLTLFLMIVMIIDCYYHKAITSCILMVLATFEHSKYLYKN